MQNNKPVSSGRRVFIFCRISYEESLTSEIHYDGLKPNRILGIDMNPSNIGISIIEFDDNDSFKVLYKEVFDIYKLTLASGKSSDDPESKYRTNKRKHETIQIAHIIDRLMDVWKCGKLSIEELKIKPSDKKKGKKFNRVCNNVWNRRLFKTKLNMLANEHGYDFVEVNYAHPKGCELVMLPMLPWQAYSTIGWLTDTLPSRFIGMPLNEKGCLITLQ